ncbi:hypothetical protein GCM10017673_54310 [Streptosporangium violaceochromogenes]|nr:hypothetical protein GCM10017673_54310 [Streptosporangium violaceochromogenes]
MVAWMIAVGSLAADAGHTVILLRREGGETGRLPVPSRMRALPAPLPEGRVSGGGVVCSVGSLCSAVPGRGAAREVRVLAAGVVQPWRALSVVFPITL